MNFIDKFFARFPLNEVTIQTTINSYAVIERIEFGVQPFFAKWPKGVFFTFEGAYAGNYFVLQGHLRDPNGEDAYPSSTFIGFGSFGIRIPTETSPKFYGRVFDDGDNGSTIRGHFGFPFPIFALMCVIILLVLALVFPKWVALFLQVAIFVFILSLKGWLNISSRGKAWSISSRACFTM